MATPVVIYFAGIGTVVAALGLGFGSALLLTTATPVPKEPPAAFAKREQPVVEQPAPAATAPAPAATAEVITQAPSSEPSSPTTGLAPRITAIPIPQPEAVSQALALNLPPADPSPTAAERIRPPAPTVVQPTPVLSPVRAPSPSSTPRLVVQTDNTHAKTKAQANRTKTKEVAKPKDIVVAPDKNPERKFTPSKQKVMIAEKQKDLEKAEEDSEGSEVLTNSEPDRPLRRGF